MHEKIKNRLNSRTACYHSVQNVLSARLLSKTEIKMYIIFMFCCMGWSHLT